MRHVRSLTTLRLPEPDVERNSLSAGNSPLNTDPPALPFVPTHNRAVSSPVVLTHGPFEYAQGNEQHQELQLGDLITLQVESADWTLNPWQPQI